MELAIAKGRAMLNEQTYHVTLVKTAGFDGPRDHQVVVSVNDKRILFKDSGDVSEKNGNERFEVSWRAGQNVRVTVQNLDYRTFLAPNDIAFFEGPSLCRSFAWQKLNLAQHNTLTASTKHR